MTLEERETELYRLMKLTAGIRLYNRDLDPENLGAAIPDCKFTAKHHSKVILLRLA